jgi:hypothetical protein
MRIDLPEVWGGPDTGNTLASAISEKFFAECQRYYGGNLEDSNPNEGDLEVVFEYPGSVRSPEFSGHKVGTFSRSLQRIQVCFAVPKHLLNSPKFAEYFIQCLETSIGIAKARFDKHGILFDVAFHLGLVESFRKLDLRTAQPLPWLGDLLKADSEGATE